MLGRMHLVSFTSRVSVAPLRQAFFQMSPWSLTLICSMGCLALLFSGDCCPVGIQSSLGLSICSEVGGRLCGVDKDVVLGKFFDVGLDLVHFLLEVLFSALLSDSVELAVVGLLLEVLVEDLPLLFESGDEFLAFLLWHEHLLLVTLVLFLNLHLSDKVVFVLDFGLNLGYVLGDLAVSLLLEHVGLLGGGQLGSGKDVLDGVGDDEVFVGDETVDRFLILAWDRWLLESVSSDSLLHFSLSDKGWLTSSLLSEASGLWLESALWCSHGGAASKM